MRVTLYIVSILVNGAAIVVRPMAAEWGDALQYVGGALAAFTGVVALSNVERESALARLTRKVETGEVVVPVCGFPVDRDGALCTLPAGHAGAHAGYDGGGADA